MIREPAATSVRLARRLAEICRRRSAGAETVASEVEERRLGEPSPLPDPVGKSAAANRSERFGSLRVPVGIDEILPGGILQGPAGTVFVHERLRSAIERPSPEWGKLRRTRGRRRRWEPAPDWMWECEEATAPEEREEGSADPPFDFSGEGDLAPEVLHNELEQVLRTGLEHVVFLDLETGGLGSACVFLAGTMRWSGQDFVLRQFFARDYAEEVGLLHHLAVYLEGTEVLVTFNGKSFDVPLLRDRAIRHRVPLRLPPQHLDLLHHARSAWKGRVPDCRLTTLEAYVCRRRRSGDVPGDEIPALYHDYVRVGGAERLIPLFHHNLLDVLTMEELLRRLI